MRYGFFPGCAYGTAAGYRESIEAVNQVLGIELIDIVDWNCCGATAAVSLGEDQALNLCGRIFALSENQGFDEIITVCNACYATLQKFRHKIEVHPDLLPKINSRLQNQNLRVSRIPPVRHYLEVLARDLSEDQWPSSQQGVELPGPVAVYYGCQLTRPYGDRKLTERPDVLEPVLRRLGVPVVEHSAKTLCCGASHMIAYTSACSPLVSRIIKEISAKGADVVTTICPMCQFNLDEGQSQRKGPKLPVTYFTQIIGLALGIDPKHLGLDKLLTPFRIGTGV